jgi:hypothetical protein
MCSRSGNAVLFQAVAYGSFHEDRHKGLDRLVGEALGFGFRVLPDPIGWNVLVAVGEPVLHLRQVSTGPAGQFVERVLLGHLTHRFRSTAVPAPRIAPLNVFEINGR